MGCLFVVFEHPAVPGLTPIAEADKQMLVERLVAHRAVEALELLQLGFELLGPLQIRARMPPCFEFQL
jgi:hypothetical protein